MDICDKMAEVVAAKHEEVVEVEKTVVALQDEVARLKMGEEMREVGVKLSHPAKARSDSMFGRSIEAQLDKMEKEKGLWKHKFLALEAQMKMMPKVVADAQVIV